VPHRFGLKRRIAAREQHRKGYRAADDAFWRDMIAYDYVPPYPLRLFNSVPIPCQTKN
jgi:hypothetical protein